MLGDPNNPGFWYVVPHGERFRKVLQPERATRDLRIELRGKRLASTWVPPKYEIVGKGGWPDWMAFWTPLISRKALSQIRDLVFRDCEFLPWISEHGAEYTLLNVTTRIPKENWSCIQCDVDRDVHIAADIISVHGVPIPNLFRLEGYYGKVFVSDDVARAWVTARLKGAAFVDPRVPSSHLPFIRKPRGKTGTGFIRLEDDMAADEASFVH